jgi:excisionase family DNA binding protein
VPESSIVTLIKYLYTIPQAASSLGISQKTVWHYLATGELKARRIGRRKLIPRESLERFAARDHAGRPKEKERENDECQAEGC